eukprot:CFRG4265T1
MTLNTQINAINPSLEWKKMVERSISLGQCASGNKVLSESTAVEPPPTLNALTESQHSERYASESFSQLASTMSSPSVVRRESCDYTDQMCTTSRSVSVTGRFTVSTDALPIHGVPTMATGVNTPLMEESVSTTLILGRGRPSNIKAPPQTTSRDKSNVHVCTNVLEVLSSEFSGTDSENDSAGAIPLSETPSFVSRTRSASMKKGRFTVFHDSTDKASSTLIPSQHTSPVPEKHQSLSSLPVTYRSQETSPRLGALSRGSGKQAMSSKEIESQLTAAYLSMNDNIQTFMTQQKEMMILLTTIKIRSERNTRAIEHSHSNQQTIKSMMARRMKDRDLNVQRVKSHIDNSDTDTNGNESSLNFSEGKHPSSVPAVTQTDCDENLEDSESTPGMMETLVMLDIENDCLKKEVETLRARLEQAELRSQTKA